MFRTFPLSISSNFALYTQQWYMCWRLANRIRTEPVPSWSCSQAVSKPVRHIPLLWVQWKTPDYGQRNCPKHVEFYSKDKFWEISSSGWFYYKNSRGLSQNIFLPIHCDALYLLWGQTGVTVSLSTHSVKLLLRGQASWMDLFGPALKLYNFTAEIPKFATDSYQ